MRQINTNELLNTMKRFLLFALTVGLLTACRGPQTLTTAAPQPETEYRELDTMVISAPKPDELKTPEEFELPRYNPSAKRTVDLLHTRLDLRFDWEKEQVLGKATLTLRPYFHPIDRVVLDAKNFELHAVRFADRSEPLRYDYDGRQLTIHLDRSYTRNEELSLFIDYTASPNETGGSAAITSDKGLFFINPRGEEPDKPRQIWTQGETEYNSRWFPTIDKPNERCTQELLLTVADTLETLSNGLLVASTNNGDGTRTDHWKLDQPHAPYLFMIAVGDYAIVRDTWNGIPVEYYVEPEYEPYARRIFPHTPEMLQFFSDKLDYPYPWPKYSQVVVRDYVSGAMENTTAVIYGEFMQGTERDLIDEMTNDKIVAHELFHHWFGDLVTCESWANLTLQEGFANYSEYLWMKHKYGQDEADYHLLTELQGYLAEAANDIHPLIHFGYEDKEDMFDAHSYNKGGLVLHMLHHYVGDEAFFAALNRYLTQHKYTEVEADELRLAFEDVTGEDLNWFFDQWFFQPGHPRLDISTSWDESSKTLTLTVEQQQPPDKMPAIFRLPTEVDIYDASGKAVRHPLLIDQRRQSFTFQLPAEPALVNFDPDNALLAEKSEELTPEKAAFQYAHCPSFRDRYEALKYLSDHGGERAAHTLEKALQDPFWLIRLQAAYNVEPNDRTLPLLEQMAETDPHSYVRAGAVEVLGSTQRPEYASLFRRILEKEPSYYVIATGLSALGELDPKQALELAAQFEDERNGDLLDAIGELYAASGDPRHLPFFEKRWADMEGFAAIGFLENYAALAAAAELPTLQKVGEKLKAVAIDMNTSPFKRYAATNALNTLHAELINRLDGAAENQKNALEQTDDQILQWLEEVKKAETNSQLKMMYQQFPDPAQRP